ncbi:hypothetical protein P5673_026131 [Acropora cervicornis]|uniref:Uncharacterized protein n=1 Tax=Acropora cervicornis TaxID=6130 RepID=A0AAD9UWX8_ACRCE|nr:hypothetical protein P5673_026131 [Acropora cervicornis]
MGKENTLPSATVAEISPFTTNAQTACPTVYNFLSRVMQLEVNTDKKLAPMTLIYAIIMFTRCKELSRVQRVNTVLLTEGNASQELVDREEERPWEPVTVNLFLELQPFINSSGTLLTQREGHAV